MFFREIQDLVDKQSQRLSCGAGISSYWLKYGKYEIKFKNYGWQKETSNLYLMNVLPGS